MTHGARRTEEKGVQEERTLKSDAKGRGREVKDVVGQKIVVELAKSGAAT